MQDVCCIISAIRSHAEVSLEVRPRCIKLLWEVDYLLILSDLNNRDCCPSKICLDWVYTQKAIQTLPIGVTTHSNASIKSIVSISRKNIPISSFHCSHNLLDLSGIDTFGQELPHE